MDVGFEVPKELADRAYRLVEKAKAEGRIRKGSNEVTKSVERAEAKLIVVAEDVNPQEIVMHLPTICKEKNIPIISVPVKEELGASAGLPIGTAAIAIVDAGAGQSLLATVVKDIEILSKPKSVEAKKDVKKEEKKEVKKEIKKDEKKPEEASK
jgi:large subunit ribosomal protein L7Ae